MSSVQLFGTSVKSDLLKYIGKNDKTFPICIKESFDNEPKGNENEFFCIVDSKKFNQENLLGKNLFIRGRLVSMKIDGSKFPVSLVLVEGLNIVDEFFAEKKDESELEENKKELSRNVDQAQISNAFNDFMEDLGV